MSCTEELIALLRPLGVYSFREGSFSLGELQAVMGVPEGFSWMRAVIEDILPCQLGIFYWFRYCTWQETEQYRLTWGALNAMSWTAWMLYHEGPVEP